MYARAEAKLSSRATDGAIGGGAALQSNHIGPRDVSPIENQLQRQLSLLSELEIVVNGLIDDIKPVMRYDPRENTAPETCEKPVSLTCALEREIEVRNDMLANKIHLLRQVHEVICL